MTTPVTYYAVFFDGQRKIGHKRVPWNVWNNLTDGIECKQVVIEGAAYSVGQIKIFDIINSVDNNRFAVIDVNKIT